MSPADSEAPWQIRQFKAGFDALGILVDFLSRKTPFDRFHCGRLVTALKYQIVHRHHVSVFRGETLIGYCGWLQIEHSHGELWLREAADLTPASPERADAVALTLVRIDEPAAVRPLIRAWLLNRIYAPDAFGRRLLMYAEATPPKRALAAAPGFGRLEATLAQRLAQHGALERSLIELIGALARNRPDLRAELSYILLFYCQVRFMLGHHRTWETSKARAG